MCSFCYNVILFLMLVFLFPVSLPNDSSLKAKQNKNSHTLTHQKTQRHTQRHAEGALLHLLTTMKDCPCSSLLRTSHQEQEQQRDARSNKQGESL